MTGITWEILSFGGPLFIAIGLAATALIVVVRTKTRFEDRLDTIEKRLAAGDAMHEKILANQEKMLVNLTHIESYLQHQPNGLRPK